MKEIGGYFGLEQLRSNEYYNNLIAVNTARNALVYIIKAKKIKKLYLPYFLCDSVPNVCRREKIEYNYYKIGRDFLPVFDKDLGKNEYLYVVNYYGQISNEKILELKELYKNVIFDNVQAFFQKPVYGIDTIYSCRKFFGVPDGGYVYTDKKLDGLKKDISKTRMAHILGRYEGESASVYYEDFKRNDYSFAELELREMSSLTHNILGAIDYKTVRKKREINFSFIHDKLGSINGIDVIEPIGPYAYPFYCKAGMDIKGKLVTEKIFVATLWPNVLDMENSLEKDYTENILPLPCDQRYGLGDMERIVNTLKKYMREVR